MMDARGGRVPYEGSGPGGPRARRLCAPKPATALKARAHGKITYAEMGERLRIRESSDTSTAYGGYALKQRQRRAKALTGSPN